MAESQDKSNVNSIHSDPNFSVICSFLVRYGHLLGFENVSFEELEKWIDDTRYVNTSLKELLIRLLKRWKSSVNEDRLQQYLIKFCHTYSQIDAWEVEGFGFQRCKTETKLRLIKNLLERQFDFNAKFKEKINDIPAGDLRCRPIGRDSSGKAYWFLVDSDMNMRIYREEQDDVQNETWQIVVSDRSQLASLIASLEQNSRLPNEKSRSATPSTVSSELAPTTEDPDKQVADLSVSDSSLDGVMAKAEIKEDCEQSESKPKADGDSDKLNTTLKSETDVAPDCCQIKTEPVDVPNEDSADSKSALSTETEKTVVKADEVSLGGESKCTDCDDKNSGSIVSSSVPDAKEDNSAACKEIEKPVDVVEETDLSSKQNLTSTEACVESCTQPAVQKTTVKRKRLPVYTSSASSSDEAAAALSESELSESSVPNSCGDQSTAAEEPPIKRKRDKALKTAAERDRRLGICKGRTSVSGSSKHSNSPEKDSTAEKVDSQVNVETSDGCAKSSVSADTIEKSASDTEVHHSTDENDKDNSKSDLILSSKPLNLGCEVDASIGAVTEEQKISKPDDSTLKENESSENATNDNANANSSVDVKSKKSDSSENQNADIELDLNGSINVATVENSSIVDAPKLPDHERTNESADDENDKSTDTIVAESSVVTCQQTDTAEQNKENEFHHVDNEVEPSKTVVNTAKGCRKVYRRRGRKKKVATNGEKTNMVENIDVDKANLEHTEHTPLRKGRARKSRVELLLAEARESMGQSDDDIPLSELKRSDDDIPLIELRRSSRANKGQRKIEQYCAEKSSKRSRKQEEKERKLAEKEERRKKREAELQEQAAMKAKKKKRGKLDSDDDFVPGKKANGRKVKCRGQNKSNDESADTDATDEIDEMFEPETEEEVLHFSETSSDEQLESDGSEYMPRGRNAKRAAAIKQRVEMKSPIVDDKPCTRCGKSDQPEWILLCDRCDAGYHTGCLRPPLMAIPEDDWFCPVCEHQTLIEKLQEQLNEYDEKIKQNTRLSQRKERLAFVTVNVSNIITDQERRSAKKGDNWDIFDDEASDDAAEEVEKESSEENLNNKPVRAKQSRNRQRKRSLSYESSESESQSETEYSSGEESDRSRNKHRNISHKRRQFDPIISSDSDRDDWAGTRRTRRARKDISYKFEEFDKLITGAIEDDVKSPKSSSPPPPVPVQSRGKDMSNITGIDGSDDEEKPAVRKRKKRNLTQIDSDEEDEDQGDESEEYKFSDSDAQTSGDEEYAGDSAETDCSDDWNIGKKSSSSWGTTNRSSKRSRRPTRFDDFVNDESDDDSDYCEGQRRTRRAAARRTINYHEVSNSDTESDGSRAQQQQQQQQKVKLSKNAKPSRLASRRRLKDSDSEYQPSTDAEDERVRPTDASSLPHDDDRHNSQTLRHKRLGSSSDESGSEAVSKKKGRLNRIVSTSESEEDSAEESVKRLVIKPPPPPAAAAATATASVVTAANILPATAPVNGSAGSIEPSVNGKSDGREASVTNGNADSLNNRSFAIANLLKSSNPVPVQTPVQPSKHTVSDIIARPVVKQSATDPATGAALDDDSLSGIEDLVEYIAQS